VNVAVFCPAATVTVAGTVAAGFPLAKFTTTPPAPASPFRVTVPVEVDPPVISIRFSPIELIAAGLIVRFADWPEAFRLAVICAVVEAPTLVVFTVKVVADCPAGTVTVNGTDAEDDELERLITAPLGPVLPLNVTVAAELAPPMTADGFKVSADTVRGLIVRVAV
jgi:hypothetical protein